MKRRTPRPALDPKDRLTSPEEGFEVLRGTLEKLRREEPRQPILALPAAAELEGLLPAAAPRRGTPFEKAWADLSRAALPHRRKNAHPGFHGYVCSPGLPTDPLAHALTAALNQNVTSFSSAPGAVAMEQRLISWLAELLGLPRGAAGLLLSGGSAANFTAILTALVKKAGPEVLRKGIPGVWKDGPLTFYGTRQAHFSLPRAAVLSGLGRDAFRTVPEDGNRRMDPRALEALLDDDGARGMRPFCVVASAGTTSTGALDPMEEIAEICRHREIWFHVDGAYGSAACLSDALRPRLAGLELADSVTFDLHKWAFLAFDASALLLRDPGDARRVFYTRADYVPIPREPPPEQFAFFHHGPETSRRARALPAVLAFLHYGTERLGRNVEHNVLCAEYLAALVDEHSELELVAPPELSILCFRYRPAASVSEAVVDRINARIREHLLGRGDFYLSETLLEGRPVLRVAVLSHHTRAAHMEALVEAVIEAGQELSAAP